MANVRSGIVDKARGGVRMGRSLEVCTVHTQAWQGDKKGHRENPAVQPATVADHLGCKPKDRREGGPRGPCLETIEKPPISSASIKMLLYAVGCPLPRVGERFVAVLEGRIYIDRD